MVVPVGTCYEDAWRYLIKEEEGELIHGTVESLGRRIGHAWVELPTGYIWDPQTKSYFSIKDFDIAASPIEEHRYTVEEAAIMLARVGKHGPWTKEEKEQFLKGGNPEDSERLLKVAIEREPLGVAKQLGYEVHRLSPKDIVDKDDYARGYRYRLSKADPRQPYPQIIMARNEGEVATFLKRQIEGNPIPEEVPAVPEIELYRTTRGFEEDIALRADLETKQGYELHAVFETPADAQSAAVKLTGQDIKFVKHISTTGVETWEVYAKPPAVGGNPTRTEAQRKSLHERIFGKASTPPLERLRRGETVNNLLPMSPEDGPPLPRVLALRWPWKK